MNIVYISKTENVGDVLGKFQSKFPKFIKNKIAKNKISFKNQYEDVEWKVFISSKYKDEEIINIGEKIRKTILENEYKTIVLSNEIRKNDIILNKLNTFNILNGRWLFNYLVYDILEYVLHMQNKELKNSEISIMVTNSTDTNIENILRIAEVAKTLNIITENISVFKQIEEKLLEEKGIAIRVTNNKKKGLLKSDIIINLDYEEEKFKKYSIPNRRNNYKCWKSYKIYKKKF